MGERNIRIDARRVATCTVCIVFLVLVVAACSKQGGAPKGGAKGAGGAGGGGGFKMPPMPAEVAAVVQGPIADRFEAIGTLEAGESITVVSEIDGIVVELPFREGGQVRQGALLMRLENTQLRAEVARAEAVRDQSRITYDRVKSVVDQQAGAPQDLDDAGAALKVAEANLALAQSRLDKTTILAPWDGIVGSRAVSRGAFVRAGQTVTDLTQVREMKVRFSAPERYLGVLQRGAAVRISTPAFPDQEIDGKIDVVEPVLDAELRSARIVARVPNPGGGLRSGMSANVTAVLQHRDMALTIPSEAVFVDGAQTLVYVVKADSAVTRVAITIGTRTPDRVEITSGLQFGQHVVRAGHQKLFEGAKVVPVMSDVNAAGAGGTATP